MTMFPFDSFIRLVEFDRQMKQIIKQIQENESSVARLQGEKAALLQDLEHMQQAVHDMQKVVDARELEMKVLDERIAQTKHKIEHIATPKEYSSLRKELDALQTQQHEFEETLVQAWHQLELAQKNLLQKNDVVAQAVTQVEHTIAAKEAALIDDNKKFQKLQDDRKSRTVGIPEEWLETYSNMGSRVDDPVVPVQNGACSGCFYEVSSQDMVRIKKRALLQCNSCYRFIYDPAFVQAQEELSAQD